MIRRGATLCKHRVGRHLVQLSNRPGHLQITAELVDRGDHREHERVGSDQQTRLHITRYGVVYIRHELGNAIWTEPLCQCLLLLCIGQRRELQVAEIDKELLRHAGRPGGAEQYVALWREHLAHMYLYLLPFLPTLIEAVQKEECASCHHGLAEEAVVRLDELEAEEGIDPVPRGGEGIRFLEQPPLQPCCSQGWARARRRGRAPSPARGESSCPLRVRR